MQCSFVWCVIAFDGGGQVARGAECYHCAGGWPLASSMSLVRTPRRSRFGVAGGGPAVLEWEVLGLPCLARRGQ